MTLAWILASTFLVSIISLVGAITLAVKENLLHRAVFCLIGFSAGALIAGAFLHLLPEALEKSQGNAAFYYVILGIVFFFLMEKYLHWRHCHDGVCDVHAFTYLNLFGDSIHNFLDGLVIAASFIASVKLGLITTAAIILHEIPQELGDFGVLIYGGFSKKKALFFNFISALMATFGALVGYFLSEFSVGFSAFILPLTAGGFIYIGASDLIPEIHRETNPRRSFLALLAFLLGIAFMAAAKAFLPG